MQGGSSPRQFRMADYIQRELSEMFRTELKDPRIAPMLTISAVEVSRDLSLARVYYSVLGSEAAELKETQAGLEHAAGFLRSKLASGMQTRVTPQLRFIHDDSMQRGAELSALIDKAVASNSTEADE